MPHPQNDPEPVGISNPGALGGELESEVVTTVLSSALGAAKATLKNDGRKRGKAHVNL